MSKALRRLSELRTRADFRVMKALTVSKVTKETSSAYTIFFNEKIDSKPGQFIMLWLPGSDEKPFTISYSKPSAVTFEVKGKYTKALCKVKKNDKLFYRGPFGKGYSLNK